jgi:signal transduction histidine kinase
MDRELAEELAGRVAMAVENALLYQQSQHAVLLRDRFLSVAAHELRTPLTALELAVRTLRLAGRRGPAGEAQMQLALASTQRQVVRLERLVESLLDVSRIQADKVPVELEPMELGALVREVVELHAEEARRCGSPVSVHVPEPVVGVWDRALLEQVLTHLLDNALKYGAGRPVSLSVLGARGRAVLQVHDRGIGVQDGAEERIFQRFERAVPTAHYGGLGLGLYIVREALERLGGHIQVRKAPGHGSIFIVTLPLRPSASAVPAEARDGGAA